MKKGLIVLVYVDNCIIISDNKLKIQHLVHSLSTGSEEFVLTQEGTLDKFLGIDIKPIGTDSYELSQPFLIERLINFVEDGIEFNLNEKKHPLLLESLCCTKMFKESHVSIPGTIEQLLAWQGTFKVALVLRFQWLCINVHGSLMIQSVLMKGQ
jgi:hypothetical protein